MTKEKITRPGDIVAIARAGYEAYVAKDLGAIERLIAGDFHFTSPQFRTKLNPVVSYETMRIEKTGEGEKHDYEE
jgi:hypothetical protein